MLIVECGNLGEMSQVRQKKSLVSDFFTLQKDTRFASCHTCKQSVSRGGKVAKHFNTTNLVLRLKSEYEERQKGQKTRELVGRKGKQNQLFLQESYERTRPFDINHPRAQCIHQRIGEMIAVDSQLFSITEDDCQG